MPSQPPTGQSSFLFFAFYSIIRNTLEMLWVLLFDSFLLVETVYTLTEWKRKIKYLKIPRKSEQFYHRVYLLSKINKGVVVINTPSNQVTMAKACSCANPEMWKRKVLRQRRELWAPIFTEQLCDLGNRITYVRLSFFICKTGLATFNKTDRWIQWTNV